MGSGKTLVGAFVADRTKANFHDLDLMVELEAGMTIPEIFATSVRLCFASSRSASCLVPCSPAPSWRLAAVR